MSFRWNMSMREPSDKSFVQYGNELVATSIGITSNRTMLSCVMNMDAKEYKYYKSDAQILEAFANIFIKQKQWAFRLIQKSTHYHRDVTNTIFLPQALNHGNYDAMSKFLQKLRNNRVGAYVKLSLQQSKGYFQKAATLLKPTTKIVRERLRFGFVRMRKNMFEQRERELRGPILDDIDRISSIENKDSDFSGKHNTHTKHKNKTINISYTLVKINPETIQQLSAPLSNTKSKCQSGSHQTTRKKAINITHLLLQTPVKQYQFQNVELSKDYSTKAKSMSMKKVL